MAGHLQSGSTALFYGRPGLVLAIYGEPLRGSDRLLQRHIPPTADGGRVNTHQVQHGLDALILEWDMRVGTEAALARVMQFFCQAHPLCYRRRHRSK